MNSHYSQVLEDLKEKTKKLYYILRNEEQQSPDDSRTRIVSDCSDIWTKSTIERFMITANVYYTDTVTVMVACSKNHVSTIEDMEGVIRLAKALTKTEISISRVLDECGQMVQGGYESVPLPDSDSWIVIMWHFAVDSPHFKEEKICMTWKDGQAILLREYHKKRNLLRRESQEYPKISFGEARKKLLDLASVNENGITGSIQEKTKKNVSKNDQE